MPYRDTLLAMLRGENAEEIVWTADLEYWITGREVDGTADPAWRTEEGFLSLHKDLGIMPYYWYADFWLGESVYDDTVEFTEKSDGYRTERYWKTPLGEISEVVLFKPESCSPATVKFAVQSEKDLDVFSYLVEHRQLRPALSKNYHRRMERWKAADGIPSVAMPRSPLAAFFYEWAGIVNGVYLITDNLQRIEELFALMREQEEPVIDRVCEIGPPLVHFADNMSSDNMTGFYDMLMEEGHRHRLKRFHDAGISCAVHLDGVVRGLLPKLAAVGFDAIEALTPQPGGDMPVTEMREAARNDRVILWGGVPGILFAPPYTWSDMEKHVETVLETWEGSRFVLGVADQVPPDGEVEFCRKIAKMVRRSG